MNIGDQVFVYRKSPPSESHLVKPFAPTQSEIGWVTYVNLDGSVNVAGFAADGTPFAVSSLKPAAVGLAAKPAAPYFVTSRPVVAAAKPVVTGATHKPGVLAPSVPGKSNLGGTPAAPKQVEVPKMAPRPSA